MYRFSNHLTNPNLVLVRKQIGDGSCAALIVMRAPRRRYAQLDQDRPNKEKPKSRKLFWGTVGATVLTGAAVVYAKSSPDARNWLESNAPWANDLVALVYQENTTYWKSTVNQFNKATTSISNFLFGKEGVSPLDFKQRSEQDIEKDAAKDFAKKTYESTLVQTEKCDPQSPVPIKITKDMVELEQDMHENTKLAVDNYKKATQSCATYNKALFKIVESPLDDLDRKHFSALQSAQNERNNTVKIAQEAASKAKLAIDTLDRMIKAGVQAPPESVAATNRYIKQFRADLNEVESAYKECYNKAVLSDKYWNKVEAARMAYKEELQMLFPGLDLSARQLDIRGDTDLLLMYTLKQIQYLQNEIAELQTLRELKINRAIECHDEKAIIEAKVEDTIKRERLEKEKEYQKKSLEIQAEANKALKEQLKKQFEIQQEVLQDRLAKKEKEVLGKFSRSVSEQVEKERVTFKKELAAMAGKLKAIEQTLKLRSKAEAEARRSQSLWAAAEALHAATRRPHARAPLRTEIRALEAAGKDDKLVQTVLKGIPEEVRENGIMTEKALRENFDKLEKTAVKVALIGRDGASLPVYFLSWLQSKLLFQKFAEIPKDELENQPTDFSKLDTFDIIQRARYHMDHGNLANALRYVNLLQGAPRAAAKTWTDAARRHLEIRQAAEAVMAHASVSGLLYL
ncbi:MICOS complex subunit Mic60-like isoform X2 [Vanessa tameamea]|uniref:MICOS complex subunit MIC60 n=1 Tax=Vanessa tameamea TaxID=334116 RepID=A0ABM4AU46_VANTA